MISLKLLFAVTCLCIDPQAPVETHLTGVYQGKTLFIQNPYHPGKNEFCISEVYINDKKVQLNNRFSAIKLEFDGVDLYAPVSIKIVQKDKCQLTIINPDAINFHSTFSFKEVVFNDSTIVWKTVGERSGSVMHVEKYLSGVWVEAKNIDVQGKYEGATYEYYPEVDEGANKFRIKYTFPSGRYLYSQELDFHYYPDPVTFSPKSGSSVIKLSRMSGYEVYDAGGELVLSGEGVEIDITKLPRGDYVVYFNGKDPGVFTRE